MSKRISLIVGGVLAILAVVLIKIYLDQQTQALAIKARQASERMQEQKVQVLVAEQNISKKAEITVDMLGVVMVDKEQLVPGIATSFGQVVGQRAAKDIKRGDPIMRSLLIPSEKKHLSRRSSSLSVATPVGKRAITVRVKEIESVGGMLNPGDHVDILCTLPVPKQSAGGKKVKKKKEEIIYPVFQNVLILAVGKDLGVDATAVAQGKKKSSKPAGLITLALTPEEANLLVFVQEQGKIQMVLRSPKDSEVVENIEPVNLEALLDKIMPSRVLAKPKLIQKNEPVEYVPAKDVEIYRGYELEVVPLSQ